MPVPGLAQAVSPVGADPVSAHSPDVPAPDPAPGISSIRADLVSAHSPDVSVPGSAPNVSPVGADLVSARSLRPHKARQDIHPTRRRTLFELES